MNVDLNKEELLVVLGLSQAQMLVEPDPSKMSKWKNLIDKLMTAANLREGASTFELHDGSDDKKTEELHKFIEKPEWDGDPSGVYIWPNWSIHVGIGDTIVKYEDSLGQQVYCVEKK